MAKETASVVVALSMGVLLGATGAIFAAKLNKPTPASDLLPKELSTTDARLFLQRALPLVSNSVNAYVFMFGDGNVHVKIERDHTQLEGRGDTVASAVDNLLSKSEELTKALRP